MIDALFNNFRKSTVLVIGDVMIDCYLVGKVSRISPEAPVPIMDVQHREYRLGGAANVALNLKELKASPILCSVIGNDDKAHIFNDLMKQYELNSLGIVPSSERKTTIKYRVIGNKAQMLRIDDEDKCILSEEEREIFLRKINQIIDHQPIDAIIFEDYDKGLFCEELLQQVIGIAKKRDIFMAVDPKKRNFHHYQYVNLFKPNLLELSIGLKKEMSELNIPDLHTLTKEFAIQNHIDLVMTTLSEKGVAIYDRIHDQFHTHPAFLRNISDVSGAGDTVISVATLCLIAGQSAQVSAQIANLAGGIVCEYAGVVPIRYQQLKEEILKLFAS